MAKVIGLRKAVHRRYNILGPSVFYTSECVSSTERGNLSPNNANEQGFVYMNRS
ncbi:hypothetical protein PGT21_006310 [Puccinia graminis f. sp. tritici]|uniref:Uncharacterized protein n=1 Tax=Puccinia graminis f. sp. tritici TaxID=56615 RepID=A0A5B0N3F8_PUCGR|nr:hypothetical protein PGT21_006310 [Puccinia graminis f. sp. tritici]